MSSKLIFETKYWGVLLSEDQYYLGRNVVILKRECPSLSGLTTEEFLDLHQVIKSYENAVKKAFNATLFNWTCLMNASHKIKPYNPHVHFHCRPRYDNPVKFAGETFVDSNFGEHYTRGTNKTISEEMQGKIIAELRRF